MNGQLYAVGGFDGTAYLKTIEVYDSETNQWRLCGCMNYRRLGKTQIKQITLSQF